MKWEHSSDFFDKFKKTFGVKYDPNLHAHRLDGPAFKYSQEAEYFYINGKFIATKFNAHRYWNHPEVKRYMLLKAIRELK